MCCKTARLHGTEHVQRRQVRKKNERKEEIKKNFNVESHIC